jgi:hypothetical protein
MTNTIVVTAGMGENSRSASRQPLSGPATSEG